MAKPTGFQEYEKRQPPKRPVAERIRDFREIETLLQEKDVEIQAARCMDCGIPFCHAFGCPVQNRIPDFNELVYRRQWKRALGVLHSTNNFPEFTGRLCPAPCEEACTLAVHKQPVSIRLLELHLVEKGFREGWIAPEKPAAKSGKRAAVVGSGPCGLAAAQQLVRAGHEAVVFEAADRPGGLLRYGIPDYKLDKGILERRINQMRGEGVIFETGVTVGEDVSGKYLQKSFDAVLLAMGARTPRDLDVPGRALSGVYFAMDFLTRQNRINAGLPVPDDPALSARGKDVVVVGGGDTGADCIGTARRQGAKEITQVEILPEPPGERSAGNPWPEWPRIFRSATSHEEGCQRLFSILIKSLAGPDGRVSGVRCVKLDPANGREIPGSQFDIRADLVLLAMGFLKKRRDPVPEGPGVFAAGDYLTGATLVVRAIHEGRRAAAAADDYLSR